MEEKKTYRNLTKEESKAWREGMCDDHVPYFYAWKENKNNDDSNAVMLTFAEKDMTFGTPMDVYKATENCIIVAYFSQVGFEKIRVFDNDKEEDAMRFYNLLVETFRNSNV